MPFPDIGWVYIDRTVQHGVDHIVRLRGSLVGDPKEAQRFQSLG